MSTQLKSPELASLSVAEEVTALLSRLLGATLPLPVVAWDGSRAGPEPGVAPATVVLRSPLALRHVLFAPDEVGLGRAYVSGALDIDGDLFKALRVAEPLLGGSRPSLHRHPELWARLAADAARLGVLGPPPPAPPEEAQLRGRRHTRSRDSSAIQHHYDVSNDFYRLLLGPCLVYSCAYFSRAAGPEVDLDDAPRATLELDDAQRAKLDLVCRKLGLHTRPGARLLDVGCGWGSLVLHAAREYGARAVGVTLSPNQLALARERVGQAGLAGQIEIRLQDYRDVADGPYDAIASIGMAEHVGRRNLDVYAHRLAALLAPRGRLLHHLIVAHPAAPAKVARRTFVTRYVFPDGELLPVSASVAALEGAGLELRDLQSLREHYVLTCRAWVRRLEENWEEACRLAGVGRARVWRLYLAGSALAFQTGRIGVSQLLAVRRDAAGASGVPLTRQAWLGEADPAS